MKIKIFKEDQLFSRYIRIRDGWSCQRCHAQHEIGSQGLHNSHYWGRGNWSTRFDPENCDALCFACHRLWGGDYRRDYENFKRKQLGEKRYMQLEIRAHSYAKRDHKLAMIFVRELLKNL